VFRGKLILYTVLGVATVATLSIVAVGGTAARPVSSTGGISSSNGQ